VPESRGEVSAIRNRGSPLVANRDRRVAQEDLRRCRLVWLGETVLTAET